MMMMMTAVLGDQVSSCLQVVSSNGESRKRNRMGGEGGRGRKSRMISFGTVKSS